MVIGWVDADDRDPAITEEFLQHILRWDDRVQYRTWRIHDSQEPKRFVVWFAVGRKNRLQRKTMHQVACITLHNTELARDILRDFATSTVGDIVNGRK